MFYSQTTCGFYSDGIHGSRRIAVADPAWVRPTIDGLPDPVAIPATIEVDNQNCKIPPDAVEISSAEYDALLAGQSAGKRIVTNANGRPMLQDAPAETAEQAAARLEGALTRYIDATARARRWDNIASARARVSYPNPWQAEGLALAQWCDDCWLASIAIQAAVIAGARSTLTEAELLAEMPAAPVFL